MTEPDNAPQPHDETGVRKAVNATQAGSEFDTTEMPALGSPPAEMPAITGEPTEGDADLDDTVISVRPEPVERETRVIPRRDPAADEFATKDQHLADAQRPGSDLPTGYYRREDLQAAAGTEGEDLQDFNADAPGGPAPVRKEDSSVVPGQAAAADPAPHKPVFDAARAAFRGWAALRFEQRLKHFDALRTELVIQRNDYVPSLASSIGRPMVEALCGEYLPVLEALRTLEDVVPPLLFDQYGAAPPTTLAGAQARVRQIPWGVVTIFTPSGAPFALPMTLAIDALAAGNAVLLCPGERQPRIAESMRKLFMRAGFPEGLVQVIGGEWRDRRGLLESGPDLVVFEGDQGQADQVARAGVEYGFGVRLGRPTKEMMLILAGADIDRAVTASLWAVFAGGGFARGRVERVVAHDSLYDEFRMKFMDGLRNLNSHHAQLASISDLLHPQRFQTLVSDAIGRGARVTWPAGEEPGRWIHWKGGVIEGLPDAALASVEKLEGPACSLYRAQDVAEEARRLHRVAAACNVSVLGSPSRAEKAALEQLPVTRISFGEPLLNGGSFAGGSADGVNMPRAGAGPRLMLRPQIIVEAQEESQRIAWFPYTDDKAYALMDSIEADYHTDMVKRAKASMRLGLSGHKRRLLRGEA